ncbi:hypothetical protein F4809DRAFT_49003 [Biscogniauxia mediterranea]|nr:hypothetical protein F4809DRAFT_49003 [Biscogniauxia mediterranea]
MAVYMLLVAFAWCFGPGLEGCFRRSLGYFPLRFFNIEEAYSSPFLPPKRRVFCSQVDRELMDRDNLERGRLSRKSFHFTASEHFTISPNRFRKRDVLVPFAFALFRM